MSQKSKKYKCKLDGKESVSIPINLKKDGHYLTEPVNVIVQGFIKFSKSSESTSEFETNEYQRDSANNLPDKTIVYPVLFSSNEITIENGRGVITVLPRAEDILIDIQSLSERLGDMVDVSNAEALKREDANIVIETGMKREPYYASIQITIIDDNGIYYGQTIDRGIQSIEENNNTFNQNETIIASNVIIEFYNDIDWIPSIQSVLGNNNGTYDDVLDKISKMSNEIPFGASAMYDALSRSAQILNSEDVNGVRKIIFSLTDNDTNMSIKTSDEVIDEINGIEGVKEVPVISGNISTASPRTLSVNANTTDTRELNKIGFLTGGQSVTVASDNDTDDLVSIFYGEAVGALGYGEYEFIVNLEEKVYITSISPNFSIPDDRANAIWEVWVSEDGYNYSYSGQKLAYDEVYTGGHDEVQYIKFKITFITGYSSDEYLGVPESPIYYGATIQYNEKKVAYILLNYRENVVPPSQMSISVDSKNANDEQVKIGMSRSDSSNWKDYYNDSQPLINRNGKIFSPVRFVKDTSEFTNEPLYQKGKYVLETSYGSWDPESRVIIYDKNNNGIDEVNYKLYPREGIIVFNYILPENYNEGDYKIGIINENGYKIGMKVENSSNLNAVEIYGINQIYTTYQDLLPPIEKMPPEVKDLTIANDIGIYSKIEIDYNYFDNNYEKEDVSKRIIKWYINDVHISYLDNLTFWNDISNSSDPLFKNAFSFTLDDLEIGESVEEKARELNESILSVGDSIYCTIRVSDGELYSDLVKSEVVYVNESRPTINQLEIKGLDENGNILERISSDNTAIVQFNLSSDSNVNNSEIIWYVNGAEFKRGTYGEDDADRILPGETSPSALEVGLRLDNEISVQVIPKTDGSTGEGITSDIKIVQNAYPKIFNLLVLPEIPVETNNLVVSWDFYDFEIIALGNQSQTDNTEVRWFKKDVDLNGEPIGEFKDVTADSTIGNSIFTDLDSKTSTISSDVLITGQQWYASITPNDGFDNGEVVQTNIITIGQKYT